MPRPVAPANRKPRKPSLQSRSRLRHGRPVKQLLGMVHPYPQKFTYEQKMAVLEMVASHNGHIGPVGKKLNIANSHIAAWREEFADDYAQIREQKVPSILKRMGENCFFLVDEALDLMRERMEVSTARDLAVIAGILTDKGILYSNEGRQQVEIGLTMSREELEGRIAGLVEDLAEDRTLELEVVATEDTEEKDSDDQA